MEASHDFVDKEKASLYHSVFDTPNGKKVLEDMLAKAQIYEGAWDPDPHVASYRAGMQRSVLNILKLLGRHKAEQIREDGVEIHSV